MGYSFQPFFETGMAGGKKGAQTAPAVDKNIEEHYKKLYEDR
jgi:hypothetical protein